MPKPMTSVAVTEYIQSFPLATQKSLKKIRQTIRAIAPQAEETVSYRIPAYKVNGKALIYFAGWDNHISVYPIPPVSLTLQKQIDKYKAGRGTLKFPLDKPIPYNLIAQITKAHLKRIAVVKQ